MIAGAVSLIGFGVDSGIEVAAATVVLVRLTAELRGAEPDERKEASPSGSSPSPSSSSPPIS